MSKTSINRLVRAAFAAKTRIDDADDLESLELAFDSVRSFARIAVKTPFSVQIQASASEPKIPVLRGLLEELGKTTCRVASSYEKARMAAAS